MATINVSDTSQTFENLMFGAYDSHYNNAYSTVATAPSPASSGTQLTLNAGDGANFSPGTYNATVWVSGGQPSNANSEIVRVTGKSGDIVQITRTQENSAARSILVGDQIASSITAKTLTDVENESFLAYKFSVYRNSALNTGSGAYAIVTFDSKDYDTRGNYSTSTGLFTALVSGTYRFSSYIESGGGTFLIGAFFKNGSIYKKLGNISTAGGFAGTIEESLVIGDTIGIYSQANTAVALIVGTAPKATYFSGSLISLT